MRDTMREDANYIIESSLKAVLPDEAVRKTLEGRSFSGKLVLISVGKAAWQMAKAADECLGSRVDAGLVVTKHDHSMGQIAEYRIVEAGHPIPDEGSLQGAQAALDMTADLTAEDTVLFLLSGGGSALFEKPLIPFEELQDITDQMLASGADIVEMNTIRKRLSAVKGGRFALSCPARIFAVILSDILGDPLDMIASGPISPDPSTCEQAAEVVNKYSLRLSDQAMECLGKETPKKLDNVEPHVVGSVRLLCKAAAEACEKLGYKPTIITDMLDCEARVAGTDLAKEAGVCSINMKNDPDNEDSVALIAGGETVVHLTGKGKGGRNQELALAAADGIAGLDNILIFSVGSDGTDGPTDAAGGIVDGNTKQKLALHNISIEQVLADNDAYNALKQVDGLVITGPTGTNVNDVAVALIKK